jgi:glutamate synthase (NADPH/NADH)
MKLDKRIVKRRLDLMAAEGVVFVNNANSSSSTFVPSSLANLSSFLVGVTHDVEEIRASNDALIMATGATWPRDLKMKNRELDGIHFAMEFLTQNTRALLDNNLEDSSSFISARGKDVIVIGGGGALLSFVFPFASKVLTPFADTGNDCIGTSMRHGAKSVTNFELLPQPPSARADDNPWPQWPKVRFLPFPGSILAHSPFFTGLPSRLRSR